MLHAREINISLESFVNWSIYNAYVPVCMLHGHIHASLELYHQVLSKIQWAIHRKRVTMTFKQ